MLHITFFFYFHLVFFSPFGPKHMEAEPPNKSRFNGGGWVGGFNLSEMEIFLPPPSLFKKEEEKESATLNTICNNDSSALGD